MLINFYLHFVCVDHPRHLAYVLAFPDDDLMQTSVCIACGVEIGVVSG